MLSSQCVVPVIVQLPAIGIQLVVDFLAVQIVVVQLFDASKYLWLVLLGDPVDSVRKPPSLEAFEEQGSIR